MDVVGFGNEPVAKISIVKPTEEVFSNGRTNRLKGIVLKQGTADILIAEGTITGIPS